ncbi:hypothetical protein [Neomegalonema perideroedes]|uniref:hypothetical protein n=1 Tax=Neomegalonema perideroedes TaxID=217219 RepID=UPI00037022EA|nr:hypothetical protein [Neomegalonema perideroedes]
MKRILIGLGLACLLAGPAPAQRPSLEEMRARMDQEVSEIGVYRELLADPDPTRSLAAMKAMLESGDLELQAIALEYGLFSPSPIVRRRALESFLASKPVLDVVMETPAEMHPSSSVTGAYLDAFKMRAGSIDPQKGGAYVGLRIGDHDPEKGCLVEAGGSECVARVTSGGLSIRPWTEWWLLTLNEEGEAVGMGQIPGAGSFPVRVPLR